MLDNTTRENLAPGLYVDRVYQPTSYGGGDCVNTVRIANQWADLVLNGWGWTWQEITHNWYQVHNERIFEIEGVRKPDITDAIISAIDSQQ